MFIGNLSKCLILLFPNLWSLKNDPESAERIVEEFFVHLWVQVTNKYVGTDI